MSGKTGPQWLLWTDPSWLGSTARAHMDSTHLSQS